MMFLGLILLVALMIPIIGILIDSPIGRALARRLEGPERTPPAVTDLAQRVQLLEGEVDDLNRSVQQLQEENQFLQRLLEDGASRPSLPPPRKP
jgi:TolA-binding protein